MPPTISGGCYGNMYGHPPYLVVALVTETNIVFAMLTDVHSNSVTIATDFKFFSKCKYDKFMLKCLRLASAVETQLPLFSVL